MDLNVAPEIISLTKLEWNTWVSRWQKKKVIYSLIEKLKPLKTWYHPQKIGVLKFISLVNY